VNSVVEAKSLFAWVNLAPSAAAKGKMELNL